MSYTKYGEFIRILRVKHHEVMGDLAKVLDTTLPFMSAVENGKKNVPGEWPELLIKHYSLNNDEAAELYQSIEESKTQMKINLISANNTQRRLAVQFQRSFENLDEDTATAIMDLLNKEDN